LIFLLFRWFAFLYYLCRKLFISNESEKNVKQYPDYESGESEESSMRAAEPKDWLLIWKNSLEIE